jgi:hypothetical protein
VHGHHPHSGLAPVLLACLTTVLFPAQGARAATPPSGDAQEQLPEGVVFNEATGTYTVHRVPKRSLDAVIESFASWHHQVLADESTADYSAEDGILSMECSACGLTHPSAIELAAVDLNSLMAYQAGSWHIGIRSADGTQDFFGSLRGELGPEPHDPARVSDDRRIALLALTDLYDFAYLTQNPPPATAPAKAATKGGKGAPAATHTAEAAKPPAATTADKPSQLPLATLAANGDVEGIEARRNKANARDIAHALEAAYGARARTQLLEGQVDSALQTLGAGRQSFGKSTALRDREAHYVVIGDAYDRLRLAVKLDVTELRGYLQRVQTLEPDDATAIDQMLVRTLSNRIADQRVAGRKTIADDLISGGRDLFPAWADQLTQGTPGVLSRAGVEIGTAEAPTPGSAK